MHEQSGVENQDSCRFAIEIQSLRASLHTGVVIPARAGTASPNSQVRGSLSVCLLGTLYNLLVVIIAAPTVMVAVALLAPQAV